MNILRQILLAFAALFSEPARHRRGLHDLMQGFSRLLRRIVRLKRPPPRPSRSGCCVELPRDVYKRPDPLIYDQYYLMQMGLAVTWDNPDIHVYEYDPAAPDGLGAPVPSSALAPTHHYRVRVRVWNGSYDAPAVGLPVHLSYLSFGIATTSTPVGTTYINLGVKGSSSQPAFAFFDWITPGAVGHYCLQARLEWADDANPNNNLGQENTQVVARHSPASFTFPLRNQAAVTRRFVLESDAYRLPKLPPCGEAPDPRLDRVPSNGAALTRLGESQRRWERARREQGYGMFSFPDRWSIKINPSEITLASDEERTVEVTIEGPDQPSAELSAVNVHAFVVRDDGTRDLEGGVTAVVTAG